MDMVCFSDTHGKHRDTNIPLGDILIFAGDMSPNDSIYPVIDFMNWFISLDFKYKVFCCGNHDRCMENKHRDIVLDKIKEAKNMHYLQDSEITLDGLKFYGSPWQPKFYNWAFNLPRGNLLLRKWEKIPDDTNVLITHSPPFSILDNVKGKTESLGCEDLYNEVTNRIKPALHVFGHIHTGHGQKTINNTTFVNASVLNERYRMKFDPIVVNI